VTASASNGVAEARLGRGGIEDTITLVVAWQNLAPAPEGAFATDGTSGHAVYMASWAAPTADCHTQQGFHYVGHRGELRVDQAHRGYSQSADVGAAGGTGALATLNPLYMRYTPDATGWVLEAKGTAVRRLTPPTPPTPVPLSAAALPGSRATGTAPSRTSST
jgi:D-galacturonate reductase